MKNLTPILLALLTAVLMAVGQTLFKIGSGKLSGTNKSEVILSFLGNPYLMVALFLYATTILIWIYVLRLLPLSIAYPITAVSYVIVPIISFVLLKESINVQTVLGSALIISGVIVTHANFG
jgi:drug/metabolite transporter (DMT)-like permease